MSSVRGARGGAHRCALLTHRPRAVSQEFAEHIAPPAMHPAYMIWEEEKKEMTEAAAAAAAAAATAAAAPAEAPALAAAGAAVARGPPGLACLSLALPLPAGWQR